MPPYRIGVLGGATLLGKELGDLIGERRFPALPPRLFALPVRSKANGAEHPPRKAITGSLLQYGDEAAVLEEFSPDNLQGLDVLFLAASAAEVASAWPITAGAVPLIVDLSGALRDEPEAVVVGFDPDIPSGTRLIAVAHPAAQALAAMLERLQRVGAMDAAVASIFEPASQRGWPGIQELEQQTVKVLGMQPLPTSVFGAQIAFNLRASLGPAVRPALSDIESSIRADLSRLGASAAAIRVLQAPWFHAAVLSLWVRYRTSVPEDAVRASLASPHLTRPEAGGDADALTAAGMDTVLIGEPVADAAGGFWIFAALDNLHRVAAAALDAAEAALAATRRD